MRRRKPDIEAVRRLAELEEIADLMAAAAARPLGHVQMSNREIRSRLSQIGSQRARLSLSGADPAMAAYAERLTRKLRQLQAAEYERLAASEAELAETRQAARLAFGRREALKALREKQEAGK